MSLTLLIIIATIVASLYAWNRQDMYSKWIMYPYRVKRHNEYHRFITSGFIHSGYAHLGFNMLSFYFFGRYLELVLGPITFLVLYLMAIVVSDLPTFLKQKDNPNYRSLGASGGVSAIIFSHILLNPLDNIYIYGIPIIGFLYGGLFLIYSYYQAKNSSDNIGHESHFFGALFGVVFTIVIYPGVLSSFFEKISNWTL